MAKEKNANANANANQWFDYMRSPHLWTVKKYIFEIFKHSGYEYSEELDNVLTKICANISTESEVKGFGNLCVRLYEAGFTKAVKEYEKQLGEHGLQVNIVPETSNQKETKKIF